MPAHSLDTTDLMCNPNLQPHDGVGSDGYVHRVAAVTATSKTTSGTHNITPPTPPLSTKGVATIAASESTGCFPYTLQFRCSEVEVSSEGSSGCTSTHTCQAKKVCVTCTRGSSV